MIGFSRGGRLRVLLERCEANVEEGLNEERVCISLVGRHSVTRSDIALLSARIKHCEVGTEWRPKEVSK